MHDISFKLANAAEKIKSEDVRHIVEEVVAKPITEEQFDEAYNKQRRNLINLSYEYFEKYKLDAIFYPTLPMLPFKYDDWTGPELKGIHNGKEVKHFETSARNVAVTSNLNFPAISLPARSPE